MTEKKKGTLSFELAKSIHLGNIRRMYQSVVGQDGCTWNELYPSSEDLMNDYNTKNLYVLMDDYDLLAAVSVVPVNELDDIDCWRINDGTQREIARVVVPPKHQGNGYAIEIINRLILVMQKQCCNSIHLLVAKCNAPAIKTYKSLGFEFLGECNRYEHDFYICEKILKRK